MDTAAPLVLNHDQTNISFHFAALSPTLNNNFQYAYKMDGLENHWINTGEKASGYYSNLPPGNYTLRIKAFDHNGNLFNYNFALPIKIKPPWYQTWWFYMLISLIILSILYAFYRYRIHNIMQVEKVRMRIATDLHDDIGSTLTSISYYSELVKMQLKEDDAMLKPVLDKIGDNARNMVSAMSDIVWLINPKNDTTVNLISRMKNYAAEMLGARNVRYYFHHNAEAASLQLNMQQRKNVYLIYKEAIHNAVKYAQCSEINILFVHTGQQLCLEVKDNGKGFEAGKVNNGGNGLMNMQNRAAEIGAQFHIHAVPCTGTTLTLTCKIP
jgi:two-component sensor histidine kinase